MTKKRRRQLAEARAMTIAALKDAPTMTPDERGALFFLILQRIERRDGDQPGDYPV